jgi:hypothetical protein
VILLPNNSPFFIKEDSADYQGPLIVDPSGSLFNPALIDTSVSVKVTQKFFRVVLVQDVLNQVFDSLEHNIIKRDAHSEHFELVLKNKKLIHKTEPELDMSGKSRMTTPDLGAKKLNILFHFYCLSIELRDDNGKLVSEFSLLNTDLGYDAFESGKSSAFVRAN